MKSGWGTETTEWRHQAERQTPVFPALPPLLVARHQLPFRHWYRRCWGRRGRAQGTLPLADKGGRLPDTNLGCADTLSSPYPITPLRAE